MTEYPEGYMPHPYMGDFKCGRCAGKRFTSYPQAVPKDRSKPWTYEYVCVQCGYMMGLTRVGDGEDEGADL